MKQLSVKVIVLTGGGPYVSRKVSTVYIEDGVEHMEVSRSRSSDEVSVMGMERRAESIRILSKRLKERKCNENRKSENGLSAEG